MITFLTGGKILPFSVFSLGALLKFSGLVMAFLVIFFYFDVLFGKCLIAILAFVFLFVFISDLFLIDYI